MAAASMAGRHAAKIVAPARSFDRLQQPFLGWLLAEHGKIRDLHEALARCARIQLNYCHRPVAWCSGPFEKFDSVAFFKCNVSFFPIRAMSNCPAAAARLTEEIRGAHFEYGHLEHLFDRGPNRVLARRAPHAKHDLIRLLGYQCPLFRNQGRDYESFATHRAAL